MNSSRLHSSILRFAVLMAYKTRCNCIPSSSHSAFIWSKQDWRHSRTHHTKADCYSISNAKSAPKSYCFEFENKDKCTTFKNTLPAYTSVFQQITSITFSRKIEPHRHAKEKKEKLLWPTFAHFCSRDDGTVSYARHKSGSQSAYFWNVEVSCQTLRQKFD